MDRIRLDPEVRGKLPPLDRPLEICDETGRKLGLFVPEPAATFADYAAARTAVTDEELDRLAADAKRESYTTAEVLDHLRRIA